ncbi:Hypothetical predicted protein [Olea europaea subsp. europaea]|uniref:Uncharacterized protein n=1 Tax=Olea europaea subsp. europaea TaxID=158383 RepID=A0A8S0TK71_OLEEU|nr:Hypothetical predicted protein [Olea europaea subsp. europaea]
MAARAANLMFQYAFEGSLSMYDMDIERRPYHRNCTCALHKQKAACSNAVSRRRNVSFPKKELWNKCSLISVSASTISSHSSYFGDSSVRSNEHSNEDSAGMMNISMLALPRDFPSYLRPHHPPPPPLPSS